MAGAGIHLQPLLSLLLYTLHHPPTTGYLSTSLAVSGYEPDNQCCYTRAYFFFILLLISLIFHAVTDYFHFAEGGVNYLNATEDETIEFGTPKVNIENYPSNYAERWILIVPEGRNVQIDFDIFELEDSEGCKNDYVEFRETSIVAGNSNGDIGPILTGRLCGNTKPNSILSQGNMVWVQFLSDSNSTTVNKGFKASFKAGVLFR